MPGHGTLAVGQLADVTFNEAEVGPLVWGDQGLHFIQVALVAGGKVVEAHHALVELEQGLQQVAANETRRAGDEPGFGVLAQLGLDLFVGSHGCFSPTGWASASPVELSTSCELKSSALSCMTLKFQLRYIFFYSFDRLYINQ